MSKLGQAPRLGQRPDARIRLRPMGSILDLQPLQPGKRCRCKSPHLCQRRPPATDGQRAHARNERALYQPLDEAGSRPRAGVGDAERAQARRIQSVQRVDEPRIEAAVRELKAPERGCTEGVEVEGR